MTDRPLGVVTGANRGIGREIARALVDAGMRVVGTARDLDRDRGAIEAVGAEPRALDVSDQGSRAAFVEELRDEPGGVAALVNNAGVSLRGFDGEVARRTIDVNVLGPMGLTEAARPLLGERAQVVNVSSGLGELSILPDSLRARFDDPELDRAGLLELVEGFVADVAAGREGAAGWPRTAYGVSKVALNAWTRILARELVDDPRGIRVNAVCPGWVRTDMGGRSAPRSAAEGADTPAWLATGGAGDATGTFFRDRRRIPW